MVSLSRLPPAVAVLLAFVLVVQFAFTGIGQGIGPHWSEPETLDTATGPTGELVDVSASAGVQSADSDGRIAWVVTEAGQYRVRVANVSSRDGTLDVGTPSTVATSDAELASVDVAYRNGSTAVVWKRAEANRVVLAVDNGSGRSAPRTVSTNESLRVNNPTVALADGTPVVAYQEYASSTSSWRGVLATVSGNISYSRFAEGSGPESVSPAVTAGPGGAVVAWVDTDEALAKTAPLSRSGGADSAFVAGEATVVGDARTLRSMSGSGQLAEVQLSSGGDGPALLWTDLGKVRVVSLAADGMPAADTTALGAGQNPGFAAGGGEWLATMMVSHRASGIDVRYHLGRGSGVESGPLSSLASTAVRADAAYAPDPVVAWSESGSETELLVSAYQAEAESGVLDRLASNPFRFVFLGVSALFIAAVTLPMMPWVVGPLLAGFFLTTRLALRPITGAAQRLADLGGRSVTAAECRRGIQSLPGWQPALVFAVVDTAILVALLGGTGDVVAGVEFSNPVGVSLLALPATAAVARLLDVASPWKLAAVFGYFQTVGLWTTAIPLFL